MPSLGLSTADTSGASIAKVAPSPLEPITTTMPTVGLSTADSKASTSPDIAATVRPPIEPTASIAGNQDDCLVNAARLWNKSSGVTQSKQFQTAACECFTKGFSLTEVATHIRESEYDEPFVEGEKLYKEKLYKNIYEKVRYIKKNRWQKLNKDSMDKTSKAVEELLVTMNNINLNKENENESDTAAKPVLVDVLAQGLKNYKNKKESAKKEAASPSIEANVFEMKQRILDISHRQSWAFVESKDSSISTDTAAAGKRRVKMIIDHPEKAEEYILMGLRSNPKMTSLQMIDMIDYYCNE